MVAAEKKKGKAASYYLYKLYLSERKMLIKTSQEGYRSFDKAVLTLAAGSFGLSLTFIKQIAPVIKPASIYFLVTSWICFALSILCTLISFLASARACERQIEIAGEYFLTGGTAQAPKNILSRVTLWLNLFSIFAFIVGVGYIIIFSIINLI